MTASIDKTPSQRLREEGNAAFRSSNWEEASRLYSEALEAAPSIPTTDEEKEHLAALYSNRAAARISLFQFDLGAFPPFLTFASCAHFEPLTALLDASAACALIPKWSRARVREAEAFHRLHAFEEARASCSSASFPFSQAGPNT
jgi:hypothetical protein